MNSESMIELLNRFLEAELMAVEYYAIHADAITEPEIAEGVRAIIPAEESHAANLATRIKELGGVPVAAGGEASRKGREMGEESKRSGTLAMLKLELMQEQLAIKAYAEPVADIVDDMVTVEMLEEQLFDEMRHAKWLKQRIIALEKKAP
ncbi:MAG: ferritin-like domain-containing protein [Desulfomonilaceae bacterium]|nr:ferritin-like domain-containing protein [Desulfomonilaceae bacterium]